MTHHARPDLCVDCMKAFGDEIASEPDRRVNLYFCKQHKTIAKVNVDGGIVTRWEMTCPVSIVDALAIMNEQDQLDRADFPN